MEKIVRETFAKVGREITGPALFNFVKWVLEEAVEKRFIPYISWLEMDISSGRLRSS